MITRLKKKMTRKGCTIEEGEKVYVCKHPDNDKLLRVETEDGRRFSTHALIAYKKIPGIRKPLSLSTRYKWMNEGYARTPRRNKVEPDGYDKEGFASWALVLGII